MAHGHGMGSDGGSGVGSDFGSGFGFHSHAPHVGAIECGFGHEFNGLTTVEALVVAHAFSMPHGTINVDTSVDMGNHFTAEHVSLDAVGATFDTGVRQGKKYFGVIEVGHGYFDLEATVRAALRKAKLVEVLAVPQGNRKRIKEDVAGILPLRPRTKDHPAVMPNGYYEGADGTTSKWRSYHQVGSRSALDYLTGAPGALPTKCSTMLEVELLRYYYDRNYFETRIGVFVHSQRMYNKATEQYVPRTDELDSHLKATACFCHEMVKVLRQAMPSNK